MNCILEVNQQIWAFSNSTRHIQASSSHNIRVSSLSQTFLFSIFSNFGWWSKFVISVAQIPDVFVDVEFQSYFINDLVKLAVLLFKRCPTESTCSSWPNSLFKSTMSWHSDTNCSGGVADKFDTLFEDLMRNHFRAVGTHHFAVAGYDVFSTFMASGTFQSRWHFLK